MFVARFVARAVGKMVALGIVILLVTAGFAQNAAPQLSDKHAAADSDAAGAGAATQCSFVF